MIHILREDLKEAWAHVTAYWYLFLRAIGL